MFPSVAISIGLFLIAMPWANAAQSATLNEDLSTRNYHASSTAVWNQGLGLITPVITVGSWNDGSNHTSTIDIGDGSHGDFNSSTWANFSTSVDTSGKIIYLNTTSYPIFKFKSFDLTAGWTISPSGTNPLVIYVQGNMTVNGTIQCSGGNGSSSVGTGGSAVAGSGGTGRCGGAAGGNGGAIYSGGVTGNGVAGSTTSVSIGGGGPGLITGAGTGSGGGGGGAWSALNIPNQAATAGTSGSVGARGTNSSNPAWSTSLGSAGGGGGSGSTNEAGGGGGAGGGVVVIHVGGNMTVGSAGLVLANGGDGGVSPSAGGGGGAGGGGSIQVWVAGTLTLNGVGNNQISAASGTRGSPATGGRGSSGWAGRTWVVSKTFSNPSAATIDPSSELTSEGTLLYDTSANVSATSSAIDSGSTLASFTSASFVSSAAAQVTLEFAGSNDQFVSDDTGWVNSANISQLNNKRFLKFRVTINNNNAATPVTVDSLTVNYSKGEKTEFEFKSSGCGMINSPPTNFPSLFLLAILFLFPIGLGIALPRVRPLH